MTAFDEYQAAAIAHINAVAALEKAKTAQHEATLNETLAGIELQKKQDAWMKSLVESV